MNPPIKPGTNFQSAESSIVSLGHSTISSASSTSSEPPTSSSVSPQMSPMSPSAYSTVSCLTWNIEGLKRNMYSLSTFTKLKSPDLVFLSEPQIFTSDLTNCMALFRGEYSCELNTEEKLDPDFAMTKSKAAGGTMVLWKKSLDKYITVHQSDSSSFLPIIYSPPCSLFTSYCPHCPVPPHVRQRSRLYQRHYSAEQYY